MEKTTLKLLALKNVKGYSHKKIIDMVSSTGNFDGVYNIFLKKSLISEEDLINYEKILKICEDDKIKIISYFDKIYPSNLKKISSPPLIIFLKGNLDLLKMPSVSIVGTRDSSEKSLSWAYENSRELASLGYTIISGGAKGIDTASHKGALDAGGNTICVLGCGLKNIYPKENLALIEDISKKGLLISECLPENHVNRFSLLERNRITSGLGDKVLLINTKENGGAMSQYKIALSQKKKIFCPNPGLGLEPTEGIKQIIQNNKKIKIIIGIKDILEYTEDTKNQKVLESFA